MQSLHSRWVLFYHGSRNNNWNKDSYAILGSASTIQETDILHKHMNYVHKESTDNLWDDAMLFWMRERENTDTGQRSFVYPMWEDPFNIQGGAVCMSGQEAAMWELFWKFVARISGESLFSKTHVGLALVNGVSINKKSDHTYVKVWYSTLPKTDIDVSSIITQWCPEMRQHAMEQKVYVVPYCHVKSKDTEKTSKAVKRMYSGRQRNKKKRSGRNHTMGSWTRRRL